MSASLPQVEMHREPDGTTLLCHARPDVPLVHVALEAPGGRAEEPEALPGLAALAADLVAEGPADVEPVQWRRQTEGLAAEIGCAAGYDHWMADVQCLREDLDNVCGLFRRLLADPALPRSQFKRLAKARRAGARERMAQPAAVMRQLADVQNLGFAHPLAHPPFEKSFARASHEDAARLGRRAFRRGGPIYAMIGGDIDAEAGFARLREIIAALPAGDGAAAAEPPVAASTAKVWIADNRKVDQAFYALGRPGVRAGDPERVALRLANYLIGGGGFESRLMNRIREEAGGTYGISSNLAEQRMASPFIISSFTTLDRLGEMLGLVDQTLAAIVADGFTEQELEIARRNRYGALPLRLTSPHAVLSRAAAGLRAGLSPADLQRDWLCTRDARLEDVNAAARRIIGDGRFRLAVIGPAERIRPQVGDRGEVAVLKFRQPPDRWPR